MMREKDIFRHYTKLNRRTLLIWVKRGWVLPEQDQDGYLFREIDIARIDLILEFSSDLDLNKGAIDVILPLIDQMHGLRYQLRNLTNAISEQPEDIRKQIALTLGYPKD